MGSFIHKYQGSFYIRIKFYLIRFQINFYSRESRFFISLHNKIVCFYRMILILRLVYF
uniref:Uncharacterized protein n=1 Tax=Podoviridae sp. ct8Lf7 TaxID=2827723 RepID=A0A8S5S0T4_9CAUD|nr:MAG TPA: hypothetical protein [Podoviridae sp. ct8Lf7]